MAAAAANNSSSPRAEVPAHSSVNLPAAQNLAPEMFATLAKLGWSVVIVMFENVTDRHPVMKHGPIAEKLGRDLEVAHYGQYDSTFYHPGQQWFFYHVSAVGGGMETLKAGLEQRGLLRHAKIFVAESPTELMTWWPPTAEKITFTA